MLKKATSDTLAARITGIELDISESPDELLTSYNSLKDYQSYYLLLTTEDAHNFVPGSLVTITGMYSTMQNSPFTQSALTIANATIYRVPSAKTFVIKSIDGNYFDTQNFSYTSYPGNSSGSFNPFITAYAYNGNLGAYNVYYGQL